jgi:methionyl aminopeptidase|tara:strand:- start:81488 stop:82243 length:756 start_codon:yes stop_codon:yes gene_type:complete
MAIQLKTDDDLSRMRTAGQLTRSVLDMIGPHVKPGVTTGELDEICHDYIVNTLEAVPAPLNYRGFPKSICTSVNHVVCHGIPGGKRLKNGDIVNIDITVIKDGFHGDASRMYLVGKPPILAQRLVETAKECLELGISVVRPGAHLGDIGSIIQNYAESKGFSVVREYCGHGIGRGFHEDPQVLHYGTYGEGIEIVPGMTFTIEPMVNAGKPQTRLLSDGWTVVTKDHSLSAQWEHTLAVTSTGVEVLTGVA